MSDQLNGADESFMTKLRNKSMMNKKVKMYEVAPYPVEGEVIAVHAGDTWGSALIAAEQSLDRQLKDGKAWTDISVTIHCSEYTEEEIEDMTE